MKLGAEGAVEMDGEYVRHFDQCLGCMACVTSCPSGVQYGKLIEATRQQVERRYPRSRRDRAFRALIFRLFPYPRRLRLLRGPLRLYQRSGLGTWPGGPGCSTGCPAACRPWSGSPRPSAGPSRCPRSPRRPVRDDGGSGCSPAASSGSSSPRSTRPPPGSWPPTAARSWPRPARAAAARSASTPGARPRPSRSPGRPSRPSRPPGSTGGRQRGRLRLGDEGVRPPAPRRPGVRRAGQGLLRQRPRPLRAARSSSARWPPGTRCR